METTPEHIVEAAHRHERHAQRALGLADEEVLSFAPRELRGTGTRAAYVEGLRRAQGLTRDARARAHLDMADALYWCLAKRSDDIVRNRRRAIARDPSDAEQEGLLWLYKAAQRFRPGVGPWKRYAISWLMAGSARNSDDWLSLNGRALLARAHRTAAEASARGEHLTRAALAERVGCQVEHLVRLFAASGITTLSVDDLDIDSFLSLHAHDAALSAAEVARDELHNAMSVDSTLSRLTPREAWALARRVGLWGTPPTPTRDRALRDELELTGKALEELLLYAREHAASSSTAVDWPFDRRGLRWAMQVHTGVMAIDDIVDSEGVAADVVAAAVAACCADVGLQPARLECVA